MTEPSYGVGAKVSADKTVQPQTSFSEDYKFISKCTHCGKPMDYMSIDRWGLRDGALSQVEKRDVFVMWIDPRHDCGFLKIEPKESEISA